jgi:hypothetical protein
VNWWGGGTMADRPIIFSGPMVRALLDGRKTQTRRVLKPPYGTLEYLSDRTWRPIYTKAFPGDRLYVREAWRPHYLGDGVWDIDVSYPADGERRRIHDGAFGDRDWNWPKAADRGNVTPLHMPRWASRMTLGVTEVRVQRLQDISEDDARDEGCDAAMALTMRRENGGFPGNSRETFKDLWNSLHGADAWDANPWVAAYSFTVQRGNIDQIGAEA